MQIVRMSSIYPHSGSYFLRMRRKFNNKKVEHQGIIFDSIGERDRWIFLQTAQENGEIENLNRQVTYELIPKQVIRKFVKLKTKQKLVERCFTRPITYTADFTYIKTNEDGSKEFVVEDFKGFPNDRWPIKKALMFYRHGIAVREVKKATEKI